MTTGQTLAKEWADLELTRQKLDQELQATTLQLGQTRRQQDDLVKDLRATLSATASLRLYGIGQGRVVYVSHTDGVKLVTIEAEVPDGNA